MPQINMPGSTDPTGGGMGFSSFAGPGMSAISSLLNYGTQTNAINTATDAMNNAYNRSETGFTDVKNQNQAAWDPYMNLGKGAISQLNSPTGVEMSPGYQFQLQQGMNAINQGAAARGHFFAPQTIQALSAYGQSEAGNYYNEAFNQLMQQAGLGFNATQASTGQNINIQQLLSGLFQNQGQMQGQSAMAGANAQSSLIGGLTSAAGSIMGAFL